MLFLVFVFRGRSYFPSDSEIEKILSTLTLEEKVGQMAQLAIDDFVDNNTDQVISEFAVKAITIYKVGSVLNTYGLVSHSKEVWARIQSILADYTNQNPSKIPLLYGLDSIHGATYVTNSTLFPQEIGLAATFNPDIAERGSKISAYETRAASVPLVFSPDLDLGLDVRWPRIWECFGEDPYLASQMGMALVRGFQGPDPYNISVEHVAACGKHYLGYGNPVSGKDRTPAIIPENYLREYHLPSFKAAVDAKVASIMVNSALINGISVHINKHLITDILKNELKFDGFVLTDWGDIAKVYERDRIAQSFKEAVKLVINAGVDMAMIPYDLKFCDHLIELVNEGEVPIERIDDSVRRILRVKARLNLWRVPLTKPESYPLFNSTEHRNVSREAASESITLLKNEGNLLPLPVGKKIFVAGPNADSIRVLEGGWSYSWQGKHVEFYAPKSRFNTIQKALSIVNNGNIVFLPGVVYNNSLDSFYYISYEDPTCNINCVQRAANASDIDVILVAVGENSYTETPGNLQDLTLCELQLQLVEALIETGKKIILVLSGGRPRIIERIVDKVHAILEIYLPGHFGGDALADIIFGRVNPSGKLPYTYPRYPHSLINYWHKLSEEQKAQPGAYNYESDYSPLWEFGFGLSYTNFTYSALTVPPIVTRNQTFNVTVCVNNTGSRAGKEVVQLYTSDLYASTAPDKKRLRRFQKILLVPGESKIVTFRLTEFDLSFVNIDNQRITEPGDFQVSIGPLQKNFKLQ